MAVFYLDTSTILKRYRTETGTEVVTEIYERQAPQDALVTSHFACLEFEAVAARARNANLLTAEAYDALLGGLATDIGAQLLLVPVDGDVVNQSIEITRRHGLRAPDAIHLAAAQTADRILEGGAFVFVTSDKEQLSAARSVFAISLDPQSSQALQDLRALRQREQPRSTEEPRS